MIGPRRYVKPWPSGAEIDEEVQWQLADWGVETYSAARRIARNLEVSPPVRWAGIYEVTDSKLTLHAWSACPAEPLTLEALQKTPSGHENARMWAAICRKDILVGALDLVLLSEPGPAELRWLTETAPRLAPIFGL